MYTGKSVSSLALSREQCRAVDRFAIEQLGIPGVVLMENAGRNAADLIESWIRQKLRKQDQPHEPGAWAACILCGKGNNGGDGCVIARHLFNRGWKVSLDLAADPNSLAGDAAVNYEIVQRMGMETNVLNSHEDLDASASRWGKAVVVVDALLGTGFTGEVRDPLAGIIKRINALAYASTRPLVVAIDVPSGLDADAGVASGAAVKADRTITFLAFKPGYKKKTAREYLGRVVVTDIGAPLELILERLAVAKNQSSASC